MFFWAATTAQHHTKIEFQVPDRVGCSRSLSDAPMGPPHFAQLLASLAATRTLKSSRWRSDWKITRESRNTCKVMEWQAVAAGAPGPYSRSDVVVRRLETTRSESANSICVFASRIPKNHAMPWWADCGLGEAAVATDL